MNTEHSTGIHPVANDPIQLRFTPVTEEEYQTARELVLHESQVSNQWVKVYCHSAERFSDDPAETMVALKLKPSAALDWTVEGAVAFKLLNGDSPIDQTQPPDESICQWIGQVIEFDEDGVLYIDMNDPDCVPQRGWFYVCPFNFLRCINRIYNDHSLSMLQKQLSGRLAGCNSGGVNKGGSIPTVTENNEVGLPELRDLWKHQWGILWGPPGTGKTYHIGNQVTSILADINAGKGDQERILIVSTTNRALDAVAIELGKAAQKVVPSDLENARLLRVGKGAKHTTYENEGLLKLLEGSDVQLMKRLEELRNQWERTVDPNERLKLKRIIEAVRLQMRDAWKIDFLDPQKKVICTTVFGAVLMLTHDCVVQNLEHGQAPFTTVFIDEAGLISRTTCAALSLLGSRRILLSGDSKQLSPISRISRIHPPNRARWIVSSGLSHLDDMPLDKLPSYPFTGIEFHRDRMITSF